MGYEKKYYDQILKAITSYFQMDEKIIDKRTWIIWRTQIKHLFDGGYLIKEIISAIPEASEKKNWPHATSFFQRIRDIIDVNRRKIIKPKINEGLTRIQWK